MDEDKLNMELRKFLKKVGVTSQREIERTIRSALDDGALKGSETLKAKVSLTLETAAGVSLLTTDIDGDMHLG